MKKRGLIFTFITSLCFLLAASSCSQKNNKVRKAPEGSSSNSSSTTSTGGSSSTTVSTSGGTGQFSDPNSGKTGGVCPSGEYSCSGLNDIFTMDSFIITGETRPVAGLNVSWSSEAGTKGSHSFGSLFESSTAHNCANLHAFCTDEKFQVRVIPRGPTGINVGSGPYSNASLDATGEPCQGKLYYPGQDLRYNIRIRVRNLGTTSALTHEWQMLKENEVSTVQSFSVGPSSYPKVVDIVDTQICLPPGHELNPYGDGYACSQWKPKCRKFDIQFATSATKNFP